VSAWSIQYVPRVLVHPIFLPFFPQGAHSICHFLIRRSHHRNARLPPMARNKRDTFFLTASLASLSVACASHDTNLRIHLRPSLSSKRRHLLGATPSPTHGLPRVWINAAGDEFANSVLWLSRTICARNGCRHATAARHSSFPIIRNSAPQTDDPGDRNANASGRQCLLRVWRTYAGP
jgi:hypothetical protein